MSKIIFIDTTKSEFIEAGLQINGISRFTRKKSERDKAQVLLGMIDDLLKKNNLQVSEIDKIIINRGPGSFTGIRVGLTVANTLGVLLNKPINNKNAGDIETPVYSPSRKT